jgi:hypothetical protein
LIAERSLSTSERAIIVVEFIAGVLFILGLGLFSVWLTLTRCLKRREGKWKCRKATIRCRCLFKPPRQIKEEEEDLDDDFNNVAM